MKMEHLVEWDDEQKWENLWETEWDKNGYSMDLGERWSIIGKELGH
jgi:hypothetical protein